MVAGSMVVRDTGPQTAQTWRVVVQMGCKAMRE
jgi:hypothetical protein